jgi:phosphoribosylformylglycinamidine synthase
MLQLPGSTALSDFRLDRLLRALQARVPAIQDISARYAHFVDLTESLDATQVTILEELLSYGRPAIAASDAPNPAVARNGEAANGALQRTVMVIPRIGTMSPWSSKATDIAKICGLHSVVRIERGVEYALQANRRVTDGDIWVISELLHDRMTESILVGGVDQNALFASHAPRALAHIPLLNDGAVALDRANRDLGLALSDDEIEYLAEKFHELDRDPTDAELMMFAQANSEHCRHKIFNARWVIDGAEQAQSLFDMIRSTHAANPDSVLSAYIDNAAVMRGATAHRLVTGAGIDEYRLYEEPVHTLMKVETHNHPTAIAPFPGAATGSGGEIRDEGATGRGAKPKAGLTGFTVSHLRLPDDPEPWEGILRMPKRIASALDIMLQGPIGGAAFNNEFGRPNILGYFRSFEMQDAGSGDITWGYHKPIMIAGGVGNIRAEDVHKGDVPPGSLLIVLGGPAMLIGLGGGAASSMGSGTSSEELDFASVQRGNPEMQRRAQQVIDSCWAQGLIAGTNPLVIIHDVGAGGLSNAVPELVDHSHRGAGVELRDVPNAEPGMSPIEIWCNEAQERYVLAIMPDQLDWFTAICERERCPFAVIGNIDDSGELRVTDRAAGDRPVDLPLELLLGKPPRTVMQVKRSRHSPAAVKIDSLDIEQSCLRVLRFPTVADKSFLITIGDRTVGGLVTRDQFVGPWQIPVSDVGVTSLDYEGYRGEAMAMGERSPVAVVHPAASGRLAVGEAITNLAAADVAAIDRVCLSANWMAASGAGQEDEALFDTVESVAALCRELRLAIPVGKDSLSMQTRWQEDNTELAVISPVSLIVTAFAPVTDVRRTLTPQLAAEVDTCLYLVDLGAGKNRLGGSCLAQCFNLSGGTPPDLDDPDLLARFFGAIQKMNQSDLLRSYHDRSDGGLFVTLCEMAFAGRMGLHIDLNQQVDPLAALFAEELGAVLQVRDSDHDAAASIFEEFALGHVVQRLGAVVDADRIRVDHGGRPLVDFTRTQLHETWSSVSYKMQSLRDNPETAREAMLATLATDDPGLNPMLGFSVTDDPAAPYINVGHRPRIAILREQGVNSHVEMAAAFHRAHFSSVDVHMSDILAGRVDLDSFTGLVACGGFSYGDVLGAGGGWAKSILFNSRARDQFEAFFARPDSFALGICNGCQMLAAISEIIPGAERWPGFVQNLSEQFEARLSLVEVLESPSIFLRGMEGSRLLIATSHGEGRAEFRHEDDLKYLVKIGALTVRYVDNLGRPATAYPANPNGSADGAAGFCSADGRVTILMPHPERVFRSVQHSWCPNGWGEDGPWMRMFRNARVWVD